MPIPRENTMLKPNGRLFSFVSRVMAGDRATAQRVVKKPLKKANARRTSFAEKKTRAAETAGTRAKQNKSDLRSPNRPMTIPAGIVHAMLPTLIALIMAPRNCSLNPHSRRYRLYKKKNIVIPRLRQNDAARNVQNCALNPFADSP